MPTISTVTAQLSKLGRDSERLTEAYNKAVIDVATRQRELKRATVTARAAVNTYRRSTYAIRELIQQQYKSGGASDTSAALLSATSTQNFLDRMSLLTVVSARRMAVLRQLHTDRTRAETAAANVRKLLSSASRKRASLAATRTVLRSQVKKYSSLLDQLKAAQRRQQMRLKAAQRRQQMRLKAAQRRQPVQPQPAQRKTITTPATIKKHKAQSTPISAAPAPSSKAAIAVKFALAQLGKPYVFAAAGPNAFDCSGLTMAAWAAAGVSLPHFAAWQYNKGHHVSRSQLQPGDLVFFYSPISHDGMYIGHGLIVHAPHTGDVVRIAPLSNWSASDYVGATRLT